MDGSVLNNISKAVVISGVFLSHTAFAVFGEYLNPKEHLAQTCKLTIDQMEVTRTPVELIETPDRKTIVKKLGPSLPPVIENDSFFCSATLIAPNALASASHCYWPLFENRDSFEATGPTVDRYILNKATGLPAPVKVTPGFTLKQKIKSHARATCPGINGKPESKTLIWQNSWPNPDFAHDGVAFDAAVFRTMEPFTIPTLPIAKDYYETVALLSNWKSCRFFGYGRNNEGTAGELHGAKAYQFARVTDYEIIFQSKFNAVGSGDSGGTLVCKNQKNEDVLVGVISQTTVQESYDFIKDGAGQSRFTPLGFGSNARWVNTIINKVPADMLHSGKHDDKINKIKKLDYIVTPFQFYEEIPGLFAELKDCVNFYRSFFDKKEGQALFQGYDMAITDAELVYNDIANEYQGYNQGNETLYIHEVLMGARKNVKGSVSDVVTIQLGRPISYSRKEYNITYPRLRMQDLIRFLRTEVNSCFNNGLSNNGLSRYTIKEAKVWMKERRENAVLEYWKGTSFTPSFE